jgi:predicted transcriptional regulator
MTVEMRTALEQIAEQQDRPLAWVVRQACAAYLAARAPAS